jgi:hypothetical protein
MTGCYRAAPRGVSSAAHLASLWMKPHAPAEASECLRGCPRTDTPLRRTSLGTFGSFAGRFSVRT